MQYGQVILFVVFCLAIYYIVMIAMDLQKAKAAKLAEAEINKEEDIDISDEAKQFNPIKITREARPRLDDGMRVAELLEQIAKDSSEAGQDKDEKKADGQILMKNAEDSVWTKTEEPQPQANVHTEKPIDNSKPKADTEKATNQSQEEPKTQASDKKDQEPENENVQHQEQTPILPTCASQ